VPGRRPVSPSEYETLAAFRYALARFLGFSEAAAASAGLTPRQYQALLALKGAGGTLAIGDLAERLQVHHNSAVGLADRLEALGLIERTADPDDRRRVRLTPTAKGERRVGRLAALHRDELEQSAVMLRELLGRLAAPARSGLRSGSRKPTRP
jgi:DNA-binding MarR family transcriptional regulator